MKRITSLAVILCLLGAALSCTHDEPSKSEKTDGNNVHEWEDSTLSGDAVMSEPMQFNMGNRLTVTRATTAFDGQSYTLSVGDRVMIELTRSDNTKEGPKVYRVTNAVTGALAYDGNETEALFWKSKSETVRLRAWSYGNSTSDTTDPVGKTFTLNTTQTETSSGIDNYNELLYAPQWSCSYNDHNGSVEVNLYHQMSRLALTLTHEATGDLSVNQVTIGNGSMPTTAKFSETGIDVANNDYVGSWTNLSTTTGTIIARQDVANQKYSAVLFPDTYAADTKLVNVKTTDSKTYSYLLPTGGTTLAAGSQYNYTITVKDVSTIDATTSDVGKIICSKGHIHNTVSAVNCGGTAVALILYVGAKGTADASSSIYKGLAIALNSLGACTYGGNGALCTSGSSDFSACYGYQYLDGITNTEKLTGKKVGNTTVSTTKCNVGHTHTAAEKAISYTPVPPGTSGWFLPSEGQWIKCFRTSNMNLTWSDWGYSQQGATGYSRINKIATDAGASALFYHREHSYSCNENGDRSNVVGMAFDSGLGVYLHKSIPKESSGTWTVHAFLAF